MPNRETNKKWTTPIIFGAISGIVILVVGLDGHWREWWVEWLLIRSNFNNLSVQLHPVMTVPLRHVRQDNLVTDLQTIHDFNGAQGRKRPAILAGTF